MEQPIIMYPRVKRNAPKQSALGERLFSALRNDEKHEFMSLIKDDAFRQYIDSFPYTLFVHDAVEIATAVFNGETNGIIDTQDFFKDGKTPLHLAALHQAPKLTKYLLHNGHNVDVTYHGKLFGRNVEHFTPFDTIMETIRYYGRRRSLFQMLTFLCYQHRAAMEVIRMLVLYMQNTTPVTQKFVKYAREDEVNKLSALFLAVPELFLSSPGIGLSLLSELKLQLNPLLNDTADIEKQKMSQLLHIFAMVGHKIAAYIRLQEFCVMPQSLEVFGQSCLEMDFFLREVARKKLGVCSPDYYLRFFEIGPIEYADDDRELPDWNDFTPQLVGASGFTYLPVLLDRKDFNRSDIYRLIPSLDPHNAARLNSAIEKKISSMSSLQGFLKATPKILEGWKHLPLWFPTVSSTSSQLMQSLRTSLASGQQMFAVNFTPTKSWDNKLIQQTKQTKQTKQKFFLSFVKPSYFALVAKYLRK